MTIFNANAQNFLSDGTCGVFEYTSSSFDDRGKKLIFDRFGNRYSPFELAALSLTGGDSGDCGCDDANVGISSGYFQLDFIDCLEGSGKGFDLEEINPATGHTWGDDYKKVLCQIFHDISTLINQYSDADNNSSVVRIKVERITEEDQVSVNALGIGSSFYDDIEEGGLLYGRAWKAINSYREAPSDYTYYDGVLKIRFSTIDGNPVLYDVNPELNSWSTPPNEIEHDLYTIGYHEALHILGFTALMAPDGTSVFADGISFNRYAAAMMLDNGANVIVNNPDPSYHWDLNILDNLLHSSCLDEGYDITGPDMLWSSTSSQFYPVFTGEAGNTSAFSHFADECDGSEVDYLMRPIFASHEDGV